jgi:putative endonuclease
MQYFVYILKSLKTGHLYKGYAANLEKRLTSHNIYKTIWTDITDGPFELIWYCQFSDKHKALVFERYLKSGSGRAFINKHLI